MRRFFLSSSFVVAGLLGASYFIAPSTPVAADPVVDGEKARIELIKKVKPTVVCVFVKDGDRVLGGGSGVIIDEEGFALTNFHVVHAPGDPTFTVINPTFACGLSNGEMYDAVTVGVDRGGDVALIKLIPKKPGDKFAFATLGNSDELQPGDWTMNMGNAQLLSTDFTPSISFGLVSGVNRYTDFGFAEHTDAIQYDTTANQGNSGGPIFNAKGEVVGLVFGGAPGKRGAFNTGIGYGLPINMAKNFLGHMRAGLFCDHATLGATVSTEGAEEGLLPTMLVSAIIDDSDAARRGVGEGDILVKFGGRQLNSVNQFKSALGIFPSEWRMPLTYRKAADRGKRDANIETLVRLQSATPKVIKNPKKDAPAPPPPRAFGEGAKLFTAKKGFANYYFNKEAVKSLMEVNKKLGDFSGFTGEWQFTGTFDREGRPGEFLVKASEDKEQKTALSLQLGTVDYKAEPYNISVEPEKRLDPPFSGGMLNALFHYRYFLTKGVKGYTEDKFMHAGVEPFYVLPTKTEGPIKYEQLRLMAEVIRVDYLAVPSKFYFYRHALNPQKAGKHDYPDGALVYAEVQVDRATDPCELYFSDFKAVGEQQLPHRFDCRHADKRFAMFTIKQWLLK